MSSNDIDYFDEGFDEDFNNTDLEKNKHNIYMNEKDWKSEFNKCIDEFMEWNKSMIEHQVYHNMYIQDIPVWYWWINDHFFTYYN